MLHAQKGLAISSVPNALLVFQFCRWQANIGKARKLLLKENFDSSELPELFTVGVGDWSIVDGALRGRQLAADKHTAFRKIYLDHKDVIYEYDMKLVGTGFINYSSIGASPILPSAWYAMIAQLFLRFARKESVSKWRG